MLFGALVPCRCHVICQHRVSRGCSPQQLASADFRGAFDTVVFAIIDPRGDGNLRPFREASDSHTVLRVTRLQS